jgi:hypothetical protein
MKVEIEMIFITVVITVEVWPGIFAAAYVANKQKMYFPILMEWIVLTTIQKV